MPTPQPFWLNLPPSNDEKDRILERNIRDLPTGYTLIDRIVTQPATTASVTFTSIPQIYSRLEIDVVAEVQNGAGETNLQLTFNGDAGLDYYWQILTMATGVTGSADATAQTSATVGVIDDSGVMGSSFVRIQIMNQKTARHPFHHHAVSYGTVARHMYVGGNLWLAPGAVPQYINKISIFPTASTFKTNSTFSLYGAV